MHFLPDPIIEYDFKNVYIPSDDSYLLIDYFKRNINQNKFDGIEIGKINNVLDLGTGTGIIAILFQIIKKKFHNFNPNIYASDISDDALNCARINEKLNGFNHEITFIKSSLFSSFPIYLKNLFDIIVFNPPYLPSSSLIDKKSIIDYSWDGGQKGNEIILEFISKVKDFLNLNKKCYVYFITSSRTDLVGIYNFIEKLAFKNKILEKRHIFFEDIILNRLIFNDF